MFVLLSRNLMTLRARWGMDAICRRCHLDCFDLFYKKIPRIYRGSSQINTITTWLLKMTDNTLFEDLVLINDLWAVLCAHNETIESEEGKSTRGLWKQLWLAALEWKAQQFTRTLKNTAQKSISKLLFIFWVYKNLILHHSPALWGAAVAAPFSLLGPIRW